MQAYDNGSHYVNVHKLQLSRVNWQWADPDRPHINVVIIRLNAKHFKTSHLAGSTFFSSEKQGRQTKTKVTFDVHLDLINIDPIHVYLYLDLVNSDPIYVYLDLVNSDPINVYLDLVNSDPINVYLDLVNSDPINVYLDLVNSDPINVYLDLVNSDPIHVCLYLDLVNSDPINVYLDLVNSDPIHVCVASLFQGAVCSDHEVGQEDNVPRQLHYAVVIYGFLH